jgi:hypothetical protein
MRRAASQLGVALLCSIACAPASRESSDAPAERVGTGADADALCAIARDIAAKKREFPQLRDFSARRHCDRDALKISYGFHTHRGSGGGWAGGVPNPDPDGVWFFIDFHDPASMRQIHTQPVVPRRSFGRWSVMFLILEGDDTQELATTLEAILREHGITDGNPT